MVSLVNRQMNYQEYLVLGPLLFLCYINDLPNNVTSRVKLYADDVLLYSSINTIVDCETLEEDLDRLMQWADRWQIRITNRINPVYYSYIQNEGSLSK